MYYLLRFHTVTAVVVVEVKITYIIKYRIQYILPLWHHHQDNGILPPPLQCDLKTTFRSRL